MLAITTVQCTSIDYMKNKNSFLGIHEYFCQEERGINRETKQCETSNFIHMMIFADLKER